MLPGSIFREKLTLQSMTTPPRCCRLRKELRIGLAWRVGRSSPCYEPANPGVLPQSGQETSRGQNPCRALSFQRLGKVGKENARKGWIFFFFPCLLIPLCRAEELRDAEGKWCFLSPGAASLLRLSPVGWMYLASSSPKRVWGAARPPAPAESRSFNKFPGARCCF